MALRFCVSFLKLHAVNVYTVCMIQANKHLQLTHWPDMSSTPPSRWPLTPLSQVAFSQRVGNCWPQFMMLQRSGRNFLVGQTWKAEREGSGRGNATWKQRHRTGSDRQGHTQAKHSHVYSKGSSLSAFSLYVLLPIIRKCNIHFHSNADDTKLYIYVDPNEFTHSQSAMNEWMSRNFLKPNEEEMEVLLLGPETKRDSHIQGDQNRVPPSQKHCKGSAIS